MNLKHLFYTVLPITGAAQINRCVKLILFPVENPIKILEINIPYIKNLQTVKRKY